MVRSLASIRGASPLGSPTRSLARRFAGALRFAWLTRYRSLASLVLVAEPIWVYEIAPSRTQGPDARRLLRACYHSARHAARSGPAARSGSGARAAPLPLGHRGLGRTSNDDIGYGDANPIRPRERSGDKSHRTCTDLDG